MAVARQIKEFHERKVSLLKKVRDDQSGNEDSLALFDFSVSLYPTVCWI